MMHFKSLYSQKDEKGCNSLINMLLSQAITNIGGIFVLLTLILSAYHILASENKVAEIEEKELPLVNIAVTEITEAVNKEKKENRRKKRQNRSIQYEWNVLNT